MITPRYVQKMAGYNRWMNGAIYDACGKLGDEDRRKDCGAFFGSIHATLNHLLWADQIWMHRLADMPKPISPNIPGSVSQYEDFAELRRERDRFDRAIEAWAADVDPEWLAGTLEWYSGSAKKDMSSPVWVLVTHLFNHQTHNRGQVHCLLTRFGMKTPVTDLPFMPHGMA